MAKRTNQQQRRPLSEGLEPLSPATVDSLSFHEVVLKSSAVVRVTYTLTTTPGLSVRTVAFGTEPVDLQADQDPANADVFKTRNRPFDEVVAIDDKLLVEVQGSGTDGNGWTLEVTVDGDKLPDSPIKLSVNRKGVANHAALHTLPR